MTQNEKFQIQRRNTLRNLWQKLSGTPDFPVKLVLAALYLMGAAYVCVKQAAWRTLAGNIPLLSPLLERHFIGSLQSNKVKYLIGKTALIHSVDSVSLAAEISRRAERAGYVQDILVELNIGREESKGGIMPEELEDFFDRISDLKGINPRGLMTIAPKCSEKTDYRTFFAETYQILLDINAKKMHNRCVPLLSMGMSDSFDVALEYGANIIRPGSAIFGKRLYRNTSTV